MAAGSNRRDGDEGFYRAIKLLREIQKSGAVGMHISQRGGHETTVLVFHEEGIAPEVETMLAELRGLLGIETEGATLEVIYSPVSQNKAQIAMLTRSMLQIMINLATLVDVPTEHVLEGRTPNAVAPEDETDRLMSIRHSREQPDDAFVAVKYRNHWFYIDDRDMQSKGVFAFLMILFSMSETGDRPELPLVTIPSG